MSSAAELELLSQVELRLALAETEDKLEQQTDLLLCGLLLKLGSTADPVRTKTLGILSHVNKRLKAYASVQLPIRELLQALWLPHEIPNLAPQSTLLVKNFALIYLEMGFPRAPLKLRNELLPLLFVGIHARSPAQQQTLMHIALPLLPTYAHPSDATETLEFWKDAEDTAFVMEAFMDVILYTITAKPRVKAKTIGEMADAREEAPASPVTSSAPGGLSPRNVQFLQNGGKAEWIQSQTTLNNVKTAILRFLMDTLPPNPKESTDESGSVETLGGLLWRWSFLLFLVAMTDSNHQVSDLADQGIKKRGKPSLEDPTLVLHMYRLYIGGENERLAASNAVKLKLIQHLNKSVHATLVFPQVLQASFDAMFGGSTNAKLRLAGVAFVHWIIRNAPLPMLESVAPTMISALTNFLRGDPDGDSATLKGSAAEIEMTRGSVFVALGLLIQKVPSVAPKEVQLLEDFFHDLVSEPVSIRSSVVEALGSMVDAYQSQLSSQELQGIQQLLVQKAQAEEHRARYAAVLYLARLYPKTDATSKLALLLASSDAKPEVREMAREALRPIAEDPTSFPSVHLFLDIIKSTFKEAAKAVDPHAMSQRRGLQQFPDANVDQMTLLIRYLRRLLLWNADISIAKADAQTKVFLADNEALMDHEGGLDGSDGAGGDDQRRHRLRKFLEAQRVWALEEYFAFLKKVMSDKNADAMLQSSVANAIHDVLVSAPQELTRNVGDHLAWFEEFLDNPRADTRMHMAHCNGLLVGSMNLSKEDIFLKLNRYISILSSKDKFLEGLKLSVELKHGVTLATGFLLGRLRMRHRQELVQLIPMDVQTKCLEQLAALLESDEMLLKTASARAISEACRYGRMPSDTVQHIVTTLIRICKSSKDNKVLDSCYRALAHIAVGDETYRDQVMELLFWSTSEKLDPDLLFATGESVVTVCGGWRSSLMKKYLDLDVGEWKPEQSLSNAGLSKTLDTIFHDYILGRKDSTGSVKGAVARKSVSVWLLCLVQFANKHPVILENLAPIHACFQKALTDRDDFTQEIGSKGVGIVYTLGTPSIREDLVKSLLSSFTDTAGGSRQKMDVSADTQIFDPQTLGSTPDGGSISTYKELLSLASELNQPDLVYKFMSLASHHQLWNARRGAAFGVAQILELAQEEIKPHLPNLIPKLYRYSFDPNPKVAESMKNIWKSLVSDPKKTIDEFFNVIVKDLLENIGNRQWRTREASCLALNDILHGRELKQLEPHMERLWTMSFRALDDIKESVRKAGFTSCKTLVNITIRYCDPSLSSPSDGAKMMNFVMPYMLQKGILSDAEDVRKFSLSTIITVSRKAGAFLAPHCTDIIATLLEGLSSMEPQMLNYLSFHADKYDMTQEQLETTRAAATKMSPMMESVELCIEHLNAEGFVSLTPRLAQLIRKGVGLPTKAGCARFLVTMAIKIPQLLSENTVCIDTLMKALSGAVQERSVVLRKSYATSAGYLFKLCSTETGQRFSDHIKAMYCEHEEKDNQASAAWCLLEISKHSADRFKEYAAKFLPIAFYGLHDEEAKVKAAMKDAWESNIGSSSVAIKLYLREILALSSEHIKSQSWPVKTKAALTIADVSSTLKGDLGDHVGEMISLLMEALGGRTWPGKESVLEAFGTTCVSCPTYFASHPEHFQQAAKIFIREAKRNNVLYKRNSIPQLGRFLDAYPQHKVYEEAQEFLMDLCAKEELDEDEMDVEDSRAKPVFLDIRAATFKTLGMSWPTDGTVQQQHLGPVLTFLEKYLRDQTLTWNVRIGVLDASERILAKTDLKDGKVVLSRSLLEAILLCMEDAKYPAVRESAVTAAIVFMEKWKESGAIMEDEFQAWLRNRVDTIAAGESLTTLVDRIKSIAP